MTGREIGRGVHVHLRLLLMFINYELGNQTPARGNFVSQSARQSGGFPAVRPENHVRTGKEGGREPHSSRILNQPLGSLMDGPPPWKLLCANKPLGRHKLEGYVAPRSITTDISHGTDKQHHTTSMARPLSHLTGLMVAERSCRQLRRPGGS
jgi:hypothetical protein